MNYYNASLKNNNYLLCALLFLFIIFFIIVPHLPFFNKMGSFLPFLILWSALMIIILIFSGFIYGILTNMKYRALALGFLFPFVAGLIIFVDNLYTYPSVSPNTPLYLASYSFPYLLMGFSNGLAGFFSATVSDNKIKKLSCYVLTIIFLVIALYLYLDPPLYILVSILGDYNPVSG
ncbi:hypothetical protein MsAg5_12720 [Methanosarcinaceae archaeon Ag5]|uniref:Uncharacterized protein n=1 Tax=Methanolapillus africanus TaxID=3028297 RepID=A0AAE4SFK2_9EURY|nr:hypothetical protein [Methanosarcinaceae archaeon Ag5]